jgi:hypothetical protein
MIHTMRRSLPPDDNRPMPERLEELDARTKELQAKNAEARGERTLKRAEEFLTSDPEVQELARLRGRHAALSRAIDLAEAEMARTPEEAAAFDVRLDQAARALVGSDPELAAMCASRGFAPAFAQALPLAAKSLGGYPNSTTLDRST